ncbi:MULTISPECIES: hypothetical protein [Microbulbifer]|uniref:hypothetical protein n=1 Tax=Microbulbifer TaxID=48073 RepID=UPI001E3C1F48|nr:MULTISPECIES: hypothetical protein [Microbulbifer]UHQ56356.1 hypothetical protein LVE68_05080 [Microbulbifer sp. YPW16]
MSVLITPSGFAAGFALCSNPAPCRPWMEIRKKTKVGIPVALSRLRAAERSSLREPITGFMAKLLLRDFPFSLIIADSGPALRGLFFAQATGGGTPACLRVAVLAIDQAFLGGG